MFGGGSGECGQEAEAVEGGGRLSRRMRRRRKRSSSRGRRLRSNRRTSRRCWREYGGTGAWVRA